MSIVSENLRAVRRQLGLTQEAMAAQLEIKRSLLGAYEEGRATPKLDILNEYSALAGISVAELVNRPIPVAEPQRPGRGRPRKDAALTAQPAAPELPRARAANPATLNGHKEAQTPNANGSAQNYFTGHEIRLLAVTQPDKPGDSFEFVAQAELKEYLAQPANASFLARQPRMSLPFLKPGEVYRAFAEHAKGWEGRCLVGRYVRNWLSLSSTETYLLVTARDLWLARLENRLNQNETLLITGGKSLLDGKSVGSQTVAATGILEIWKLEYVLAPSLPAAAGEPELTSRLSRIEAYLGI